MKLKKLTALMMIGCSILALSACSTTKRSNANGETAMALNDVNGANGGARSSGLGQNENYGDTAAAKTRAAAKRTYYFDFDKYDVREADKSAVLANADWLIAHPKSRIILEGHTDPRGSREYNIALGENRAKSVLELLQSRGVNPNQIRVVSYGSERPAASGHSDQDFQLDRRAIIVIAQR